MTSIAVQVFSFMERDGIVPTLNGWIAQQVPDEHAMDVQVWVTPETAALEDDPTVRVAAEYEGVTVHAAPQGKLSARNAAHDHAVEQGYDAIAATDADVVPNHGGVFEALADAISRADTVAVNSHVRTVGGVAGPVASALATIEDHVRPHLHGQLSAFTADAWEEAGPFDNSLDQTQMPDVRGEEEFAFRRRLGAHGRIRRPRAVTVREGARRVECHVDRAFGRFGYPQSEWCQERGESTFHPRDLK